MSLRIAKQRTKCAEILLKNHLGIKGGVSYKIKSNPNLKDEGESDSTTIWYPDAPSLITAIHELGHIYHRRINPSIKENDGKLTSVARIATEGFAQSLEVLADEIPEKKFQYEYPLPQQLTQEKVREELSEITSANLAHEYCAMTEEESVDIDIIHDLAYLIGIDFGTYIMYEIDPLAPIITQTDKKRKEKTCVASCTFRRKDLKEIQERHQEWLMMDYKRFATQILIYYEDIIHPLTQRIGQATYRQVITGLQS